MSTISSCAIPLPGSKAQIVSCRSRRSRPRATHCDTPSTRRRRPLPSLRLQAGTMALRLRRARRSSPRQSTWAYGVHAAIVEVDPDLCSVKIRRYVCIHDCGNMINPTIVDGQVLGGIAQGIGGALYERLEFEPNGNLLNAN